MKNLVSNAVSFFAPIGDDTLGNSFLTDYRIETFSQVEATLKDNATIYLDKAADLGRWVAE